MGLLLLLFLLCDLHLFGFLLPNPLCLLFLAFLVAHGVAPLWRSSLRRVASATSGQLICAICGGNEIARSFELVHHTHGSPKISDSPRALRASGDEQSSSNEGLPSRREKRALQKILNIIPQAKRPMPAIPVARFRMVMGPKPRCRSATVGAITAVASR